MFKIDLENRDFRKSLYFYIVDAWKKKRKKKKKRKRKKRAASRCWHYSKSRANIKWTLENNRAAGARQRPDIINYFGAILKLRNGFLKISDTPSPPCNALS